METILKPNTRPEKAKRENRMNMRFSDARIAAINEAASKIGVQGCDFVSLAITKALNEVATTGELKLVFDRGARASAAKAVQEAA